MNAKIAGLASILALVSGTVYGDFKASFSAGREAAAQKQYDLAIQKYEEAAAQTTVPGQRYQARLASAKACGMKGEWEKAEVIIQQILKDEEIPARNRMSAQIFLGDCKLKQKKLEDAIAEYQKVPSFGIRNDESRYALLACGDLSGQLKNYDEAAKCYQSLIDDPKADAVRKNRATVGMGKVLFNQGKYQEAISLLSPLTGDPEISKKLRADALTVTARAQYKMKAYEDVCKTDLSIIALDGIPAYFKASAYMQAINIRSGILRDYPQAKKLLNDFEKMPGINESQKKWIMDHRAKIRKAEHTL